MNQPNAPRLDTRESAKARKEREPEIVSKPKGASRDRDGEFDVDNLPCTD
jgi:hypothetical protein